MQMWEGLVCKTSQGLKLHQGEEDAQGPTWWGRRSRLRYPREPEASRPTAQNRHGPKVANNTVRKLWKGRDSGAEDRRNTLTPFEQA